MSQRRESLLIEINCDINTDNTLPVEPKHEAHWGVSTLHGKSTDAHHPPLPNVCRT